MTEASFFSPSHHCFVLNWYEVTTQYYYSIKAGFGASLGMLYAFFEARVVYKRKEKSIDTLNNHYNRHSVLHGLMYIPPVHLNSRALFP